MGMQRMRAATLGFAKLSTCMLNLANARMERVHLQIQGLGNGRACQIENVEVQVARTV